MIFYESSVNFISVFFLIYSSLSEMFIFLKTFAKFSVPRVLEITDKIKAILAQLNPSPIILRYLTEK